MNCATGRSASPARRPADGTILTADLLARITQAIRRDFAYVKREEMGVQEPLQTLKLRSGSCRDFALLMMEAVRALGFAARFVSGYLHVRSTEARPGSPARLGGGATHAWVQVYVPGAGWLEFDPTNGIVGNHDLIRVAIGREPSQAVPLWGSWIGFPADALNLTVQVNVTASETPPELPARRQRAARPDRRAGLKRRTRASKAHATFGHWHVLNR